MILADSHVTLPLLGPVREAFAGLDRPLELIFKPGEDQPPPGTGEGLRLKDIAEFGVPGTNRELISGERPDRLAEQRIQARWRPRGDAHGHGHGAGIRRNRDYTDVPGMGLKKGWPGWDRNPRVRRGGRGPALIEPKSETEDRLR